MLWSRGILGVATDHSPCQEFPDYDVVGNAS